MTEEILINIGGIFLAALCSQWLAWLLKLPAIILLLAVGFLIGPILGLIYPQELFPHLLHPVIEIGVSIILFEGGMHLKFSEFKEVSSGLKKILSYGVIIHALFIAMAAHFIAGFPLPVSFMLGGLLIVTGPTVIMPALREAHLNKKISNYLKWEGILTDPVSAMIPILIFELFYFSKDQSPTGMFVTLIQVILIPVAISFIFKKLLDLLLKRKLLPEFLQIPSALTMVIISYILSAHLQPGSGLITVTILGMIIGNSTIHFVFDLKKFKEGLSVLIIGTVFITIASTIDINSFRVLKTEHYIFIFAVSFLIRPLAILIATYKSDMNFREKILVGFYGPKGIVAASVAGVIGSYLIEKDVLWGNAVVPTVMLIITLTVVTQSLILAPLARKLKLSRPPQGGIVFIGTMPWVTELAYKVKQLDIPVLITSSSWYKLAAARKLGIDTYYGQIIDDYEVTHLDTSTYNYLISMGENDSFNQLACEKLGKVLGKENVFCLPRHLGDHKKPVATSSLLLFEVLMSNYYRGWIYQDYSINESTSVRDFISLHPEEIIILIWQQGHGWSFGIKNEEKKLSEGDIIITYKSPSESQSSPS